MRRLLFLGATVLALVTTGVATAGTSSNSLNPKACQKTGWQSLQTATGGTFASSDACTSYAAQGGVLFNPKVTVTPTQDAFVNAFPGFSRLA